MFDGVEKFRFRLSLVIKELTNVPQICGMCFIKVQVKAPHSHGRKVQFEQKSKSAEVRDSYCTFNHKIQDIDVTIAKDKNTEYLKEKLLILKVYCEFPVGLEEETKQKTKLGQVSLNLSEYTSTEDVVSNRFLLQNSKVNSIIKFDIQLQNTTNSTETSSRRRSHSSDFKTPKLRHPQTFSGLHDFLEESNSPDVKKDDPLRKPTKRGSVERKRLKVQDSENVLKSISNNPVLKDLLNKTYEFSWHNKNYQEFTPSEAVDDIFNNGVGFKKSEEGIPYIDVKKLTRDSEAHQQRKCTVFDEDRYQADALDDFGDNYNKKTEKRKNYLPNEADVRSSLQSWRIRTDG